VHPRRLLAAVSLALLLALSGCGSDSTSETASAPADGGGRARPGKIEIKGGDNSIQNFGEESSDVERHEAAEALHGYLDARAAGAWRDACKHLAPSLVAAITSTVRGAAGKGCTTLLSAFFATAPESALQEEATADVASLRAKGSSGFAIYSGPGGAVYFIPMVRQGGHWKVAALAPSAYPSSLNR